MATTIATFRLRFPEFSDDTEFPDARVQLFLDDAQVIIGSEENRWCGKYDLAHAYYAAHLLSVGTNSELGDSASKVGAIQSKSAGGVSVTRTSAIKNKSDEEDWLLSTTYGQQFMIIRRGCFVGVLVATCP